MVVLSPFTSFPPEVVADVILINSVLSFLHFLSKYCITFRGGFFVLFVYIYFLFVSDRVSLCSPDYSGTFYVDQAVLKLRGIHLPLPPEFRELFNKNL